MDNLNSSRINGTKVLIFRVNLTLLAKWMKLKPLIKPRTNLLHTWNQNIKKNNKMDIAIIP